MANNVKRLFEILETKEVSDNGKEFKPTTIRSCRAMVCSELETLLPHIKKLAEEVA